MAILEMQRISICALKKDRKSILERMQALGVLEVDNVIGEDSGLEKMDTAGAKANFEKTAMVTEHALEVLKNYAPEKTSMLSALAGKVLVEQEQYGQIVSQKGDILSASNRLIALDKEIAEKQATIAKLDSQKETLVPWLSLDVPMNFKGTKMMTWLLGTISAVMTLEQVYEIIAKADENLSLADVTIFSTDRDMTYLGVLVLKEDAAKVEESLRTAGFARPAQPVTKVPAVLVADLEKQSAALQQDMQNLEAEIKSYADKRKELELIADYYRVRADKYRVLGQIPQSEKTFVLGGYVPKHMVAAVEKELNANYDLTIDIADIAEDEEAPVLLKNNIISGSVEGVLGSYGLPAKGDVDPSNIMAFTYIFLFGMMLSDAAYGAIVFIACAVLLKKFPRMDGGLRKSMRLFMYCGISTMVWGVLFGGYFGDVINVVSKTFFGHEVTIAPLWFAPLEDPMKLLLFSMLFGVIHLFLGLGLKGYAALRAKKYLDFFCDVVLWYMLLIGLIMMLLPSELFGSIAQMTIVFPPILATISKVLAIVGAIGILLMSGRSSKNVALRIGLGAYDLYNLTGWLSDVLSYSRLLALGLATGVIASVVNQMGSMVGKGVFGTIVFILVFLVGHIFNIGINLLGAYVHTCRLQYVEFFGKFYESGGKAFEPFTKNTKYMDIKEEIKL